VVDVQGSGGVGLSAVGTGHLKTIATPGDGILARQREVKPLVEFRVPFELDRQQIDDVERGANDSDWQPAKDAAQKIAYAEDQAIFEGYAAAGIVGVRQGSSNPIMTLPADVRQYPDVIAEALSQLRLVGVNGPYSVVLGADAYTSLAEISDNGYPSTGTCKKACQRRDHLGPCNIRRLRAHHSGWRFRSAYRPGRLDRISKPHR
jgi:uncharacterized linocin/CFP29 family protein